MWSPNITETDYVCKKYFKNILTDNIHGISLMFVIYAIILIISYIAISNDITSYVAHLFYIPIIMAIIFIRQSSKIKFCIITISPFLFLGMIAVYENVDIVDILRFITLLIIGLILYFASENYKIIIQQLCKEMSNYLILINSSETLMWIVDSPNHIKYSNRTFNKTFVKQECYGNVFHGDIHEIIANPEIAESCEIENNKIFSNGEKIKSVHKFKDRIGIDRYYNITKIPKYLKIYDRTPSYIICTAEDITNQVEYRNKMFEYSENIVNIMFDNIMQLVGKIAKAQNVYVFKNYIRDDDGFSKLMNIWHSDGNYKDINHNLTMQNSDYRWFYDQLVSGKVINISVDDIPDIKYSILHEYNIKSILLIPIFVKNVYWGFVGFSDSETNNKWSDYDETLLNDAINMFVIVIENRFNTKV